MYQYFMNVSSTEIELGIVWLNDGCWDGESCDRGILKSVVSCVSYLSYRTYSVYIVSH